GTATPFAGASARPVPPPLPTRRSSDLQRAVFAAGFPAASTLQVDERVTGDLVLEAGAPLAQDAPVAVEHDLGGDLHWLGERALDVDEARGGPAVAHRLVLQGALPTLVTDGAVQRVVDEEELHDPVLGGGGDLRGVLGVDDHALGNLHRAGGLRFGHRADVALPVGHRDVDETLAARAGRFEERMIAEAGDSDPDLFSRADDERSLGHVHPGAVDGDGDSLNLLGSVVVFSSSHRATSVYRALAS